MTFAVADEPWGCAPTVPPGSKAGVASVSAARKQHVSLPVALMLPNEVPRCWPSGPRPAGPCYTIIDESISTPWKHLFDREGNAMEEVGLLEAIHSLRQITR